MEMFAHGVNNLSGLGYGTVFAVPRRMRCIPRYFRLSKIFFSSGRTFLMDAVTHNDTEVCCVSEWLACGECVYFP